MVRYIIVLTLIQKFLAPRPKFYIKIVCEIVSLKNSQSNRYLLNLVSKSLGLKNNITLNNSNNMITLKFSGNTVFNDILPIFENNKNWLFWKEPQIQLALTIKNIFINKEHLTKLGLTQLVNILYSVPNAYKKPLDFWLKLIDKRNWPKDK
jgi:hypothetical protein